MIRSFICLVLILGFNTLFSQNYKVNEQTNKLLKEKQQVWDLSDRDINEYFISDQFESKHNGVTHIYINQVYKGIPVFNAISNFNIKEGAVLFARNNFVSDIKSKVSSAQPKLSAVQAIQSFKVAKDIKSADLPSIKKSNSQRDFLFNQTSFSRQDIPVKLVYFPINGQVKLAWHLEVRMADSENFWSSLIDADNGRLIKEFNLTLKCSFDHDTFGNQSRCDHHESGYVNNEVDEFGDGAAYNVFTLPIESPIHGSRSIAQDPSFEFASPFGWHDTDGVAGPEFTITRGNNVHAYEDSGDRDRSQGNEPDGGEDLVFDFPIDPNEEPDSNMNAAITNLFYVSNYLHDWSYYFGFDETAGNFQQNNYDKGGRDNDAVQSNGLDGEDVGNANFTTSRDGSTSFLQMFLWNASSGAKLLDLKSPELIAGNVETGTCAFCPTIGTTAITGKVVSASDEFADKNDACTEILNKDELAGNIALIERGSCFFIDKVVNAENAGAIGVIVCNYEDGIISMGKNANDTRAPSIPGVFIANRDCEIIQLALANGEEVEASFQATTLDPNAPSQLPGSFDNGIIAHEYGHGISTRLTGGPNSLCLFNDEEMGEGWSDFIGLVVTHEPNDDGSDIRGLGNYVASGDPSGRGIRRLPYSTNKQVNSQSYNDIRGTSSPHALGEVWTGILWDMYWSFIEQYGYNSDWTDKNSGNYKAVQLVFDGMKIQGCSPGFVAGRDGILAADEALFNGEHECKIWQIFAERGVGFFASEGSTGDRNDNEEDFETLPSCIKTLKVSKEMTEVIDAGNDVKVKLRVTNHKDQNANNVVLTDVIPEGSSYKEGSANLEANIDGSNIVFNLGTILRGDFVDIAYELETDIEPSQALLFDGFEVPFSELTGFPVEPGLIEWRTTDLDAFRGGRSWFIPNDTTAVDQGLVTIQKLKVTGEMPVLSFRHKYETEFVFDGGIVEISTNDGLIFEYLPDDLFLQGGYDTQIDYFTFAIPELKGFSGDSEKWRTSYIDLSDYINQDVLIRFRFGCDDAPIAFDPDNPTQRLNSIPKPNTGWFIDNFEVVDLKILDGRDAIVTSSDGDMAEANAITVVNSQFTTPTEDLIKSDIGFLVYPNPATESLNISIDTDKVKKGRIELLDLSGRRLTSVAAKEKTILDISDQISGVYIVQFITEDFVVSEKIVVE